MPLINRFGRKFRQTILREFQPVPVTNTRLPLLLLQMGALSLTLTKRPGYWKYVLKLATPSAPDQFIRSIVRFQRRAQDQVLGRWVVKHQL